MDATFTRDDLERCEADIAAVEHALETLEAGTYAKCAVCGASIAGEVKADPLVTRCPAHPV